MGLFGANPRKVEKWTESGNVTKLVKVLEASDIALRRMAIEGMAKIRDREVLDYCAMNAESPNETIRWNITQILGMIGSREAMEILASVKDPAKTK